MNDVPIAEVTFFTNVPAGHYPTDDDAVVVSADLAEQFEALIAARGLADALAVVRVEYRMGCILTTLTIGAVFGAAGGASLRRGFLSLASDGVASRILASSNTSSL